MMTILTNRNCNKGEFQVKVYNNDRDTLASLMGLQIIEKSHYLSIQIEEGAAYLAELGKKLAKLLDKFACKNIPGDISAVDTCITWHYMGSRSLKHGRVQINVSYTLQIAVPN